MFLMCTNTNNSFSTVMRFQGLEEKKEGGDVHYVCTSKPLGVLQGPLGPGGGCSTMPLFMDVASEGDASADDGVAGGIGTGDDAVPGNELPAPGDPEAEDDACAAFLAIINSADVDMNPVGDDAIVGESSGGARGGDENVAILGTDAPPIAVVVGPWDNL